MARNDNKAYTTTATDWAGNNMPPATYTAFENLTPQLNLTGTDGNDWLQGGDGDDTLNGGRGNDYLYGEKGNDTYLIAKNDGIDIIFDWEGNMDVLKFTDLADTAVTASRVGYAGFEGSDLLLKYSGGEVNFEHYFLFDYCRIEQIQFSNGVVWDWEDIKAKLIQYPTTGDDTLYGYNGSDDVLNGLAGNDKLYGYTGNDTLNGGIGNDILVGGYGGNDTYLIAKNDGVDTIYDGGDDWPVEDMDVLKFTDLADTAVTASRIKASFGRDDNLLLKYGASQVTINGYFGDLGYRGESIEQFQFSNGVVWGWEDIKAKVLKATAGDDTLYGYNDSDDALDGLVGNDTLYGYGGNDTLNGCVGNDSLYGGVGNDTYLIAKNDGVDIIDDDSGVDVLKFTDLADNTVTASRSGTDKVNLLLKYGTSQVTVKNYFLSWGGGIGNSGIKQFQFSNGVTWNLEDIKAKVLKGAAGNDILLGYNGSNDTLEGLAGNDTLYGYGGNDTLNGGTGNDELYGNDGNDTYLIAKNDGKDVIGDYSGTDALEFTDLADTGITQASRIRIDGHDGDNLLLKYGANQITVQGYFNYRDDSIGDGGIEQFQFSNGVTWDWDDIKAKVLKATVGNDFLYGYDSDDTLNGLAGADKLYGNGGNDTLNGGTGNDQLSGGSGNDTYLIAQNDGADIIDDLSWYGMYVDVLKFTDLPDSGITQASRIGADGTDLLLKYGTGQVTISDYFNSWGYSGDGIAQFQFSNGVIWDWEDIKTQVLKATAGDDILYGYNDSDDTLNGLAGNDTLYGNGGNDILNGGTGNDWLYGDNDYDGGNDTYLIAKNDGVDIIDDAGGTDVIKFTDLADTGVTETSRTGINGNDLLLKYGASQVTIQSYFFSPETRIDQIQFSNGVTWGWAEIKAKTAKTSTAGDDTLFGYNDSNDTLKGLAGNDTLYGLGGNDTLDGGAGDDAMWGGDGNDSYWVDSVGDTVHEGLYDDGIDSVSSSVDFTLLGTAARIENLTLLTGAVSGAGNSLHNILTGNAAANALTGLDGNDTLNGGDGNDGLQGGAGNDSLNGGNGVDFAQYWMATAGVTVNLSLTTAQNTGGAGTDTLSNLENVNGSAFNDTLIGNAQNNSLLGGAGDDSLNGGDGNDGLQGGLGNDTLNGGNGVDWGQYYLATAGVTVNLSLTTAQNTVGAGTDTLSNLENVNGSGFNDTLTGNAGINTLVGGAGNDSLNGGLGNDLLTGGAGQDSFVFSTALGISNKDIVTDFSVADDTVKLENAIFTALTTTGSLSAAAFKVIGAGASVDADDRILYNTATGGVLYDADGNGSDAAVLVAVIGKALAMTPADFVVI